MPSKDDRIRHIKELLVQNSLQNVLLVNSIHDYWPDGSGREYMIRELRYDPFDENDRIDVRQGFGYRFQQLCVYLDEFSEHIVSLVEKSLEETIANLKPYAVPIVGEVIVRAASSQAAGETLQLHHTKVDGINWLRVNGPIPEKE